MLIFVNAVLEKRFIFLWQINHLIQAQSRHYIVIAMKIFTILVRLFITIGGVGILITFGILYDSIGCSDAFPSALLAAKVATAIFKIGIIGAIIRIAIIIGKRFEK